MSRPIDEKIVRMTLDNARFKENVKDTLSSFKAINDTIGNTKGMDLSRIADSISTIERRFSALGVVAATVLNKMTNSALNMGKGLYSAMVDPIVEGGKKRALNIEQAKFQFEGLGMDVEKTMKSANDAVLGTAFGLDEAAVVASQFGATGMRAGKDMTDALRGISGVAAMTGSSYSDIGNIFTTVAGNGRLMGNDLLRLGARGVNAAATLGKAMGKTEEEIRKMVSQGKISFEDFAKIMNDAFGEHATKANETYAGSLSNLRSAFGRIGAAVYTPRFEQLRDIFNSLTPKVDELAKAIDPLISAFNEFSRHSVDSLITMIDKIDFSKFIELGGISNIVKGFWNVVYAGRTVLDAMYLGFRRIFPGDLTSTLVAVTEGFERLTSKLVPSREATSKLATVFTGLFSVFSTVFEIAKVLAKAIFGIVPSGAGAGVLDFLVLVAEMAIAFNKSVKEGNALTDIIETLGKVLGNVGQWLFDVGRGAISLASSLKENLGAALKWIGEKLKPLSDIFKETFSDFGGEELLGGGFLVLMGTLIYKISNFMTDIKGNLENITGTVSGVFGDLSGALESFQENVKYKNLLLIASAVGVLAVSLKIMEGISVANIAKGLSALVGSMAVLSMGMMAIQKLNFTGGIRASVSIMALASATLIMAGSLKILSSINLKDLAVGLGGLVGIMATLSLAIIAMSKWGGKIGTSSMSLLALATSVVILASAIKTMSSIETGGLFKAITALGIVFAELAIFLVIVNGSKIGPGTALGILGLSAAINVIVGAIGKIAEINVSNLTKGLVTIGIILAEIALFSKISGGPQILVAGAGITMIAAALSILMIPVTKMAKMSWVELAKGLSGMAVALLAVAAIGPLASGTLLGAVGITAMAVALNLLMPPILIFSNMSWTSMIKGFVGIAGGMTVLAGASMLLSPATVPMLAFAGALSLMGVAILAAGVGVAAFGVGLTTLATLTATSVASIISALGLLIRGFGTLIVDIVNFVVELGAALIGGLKELIVPLVEVGIEISSAFIMGLIDTVGEMIPRASEAFIEGITRILQSIADNAYEFVTAGYDIVINLLKGIQEKVPELQMAAGETVVALIEGMANAISENRTPLVEAMVRLMGEVILLVVEAGKEMILAVFGWIPGIEDAMGSVGDAAEKYLIEHFGVADIGELKGEEFSESLAGTSGDAEKAGEKIAKSGEKGASGVSFVKTGMNKAQELVDGVNSKAGESEKAGKNVSSSGNKGASGVSFTKTGMRKAQELIDGVNSKNKASSNAGKNLSSSGRTGASGVSFTKTGTNRAQELINGINSKQRSSRTSGENLARSGRSGAGAINLLSTGQNFGSSFARGMEGSRDAVLAKAQSLASSASNAVKGWLGIASPSKLLVSFGRFFGDGFSNGMMDRMKKVGMSARDLAIRASEGFKNALSIADQEEEEIKFKIVVDDDDFDPSDFEPIDVPIRPNSSYSQAMFESTDDKFRQNGNNNPKNEETNNEYNEYNYDIHVTAGGTMTRKQVKDLAVKVQTEIKNINDRTKINRGEEVVF